VMATDAPVNGHTASEYTDFAHTGPGTLAGRYLRSFWQPVYRGEDLPVGWAKPIRIMGEDFTLYRGEDGTPHVVAPRCAHRGTQLSTGWVEGDCIRCFYHGWKYDGSGQCVEMPAEDPSFPPKVKIKSYPTEEYLGLIFAYFGEGATRATTRVAPPPLPRFPDFEEEGVLSTETYTRACNYFQAMENGPDEAHLCFVHRASSLAAIAEVPRISAEETDYGLVQYGTRSNGVVRVTHWLMPNTLNHTTYYNDPATADAGWIEGLAWRVPVDDTQHVSFMVYLARLTGDAVARYREHEAAERAERAHVPTVSAMGAAVLAGEMDVHAIPETPPHWRVNVQDEVAQVGQGVLVNREHERLGRSDVGVILLRKLWERELRALAEGRPLKAWRRPSRLTVTTGL
jgi:5,5'-dehydrodivanillate O-demethylase oxygenase subunit